METTVALYEIQALVGLKIIDLWNKIQRYTVHVIEIIQSLYWRQKQRNYTKFCESSTCYWRSTQVYYVEHRFIVRAIFKDGRHFVSYQQWTDIVSPIKTYNEEGEIAQANYQKKTFKAAIGEIHCEYYHKCTDFFPNRAGVFMTPRKNEESRDYFNDLSSLLKALFCNNLPTVTIEIIIVFPAYS